MGKRRQQVRLVGLALALALVAAACGGGDDEGGGGDSRRPGGEGWRAPHGHQRLRLHQRLRPDRRVRRRRDRPVRGDRPDPDGHQAHRRRRPATSSSPTWPTATPEISSDGLKYTFKLKPGVKWAPPLNRDVTSADVAYAFQRINTAPLVAQYGFYYYGVIKGMDGKAKSADDQDLGHRDARRPDDHLQPREADRRLPVPAQHAGRRRRSPRKSASASRRPVTTAAT